LAVSLLGLLPQITGRVIQRPTDFGAGLRSEHQSDRRAQSRPAQQADKEPAAAGLFFIKWFVHCPHLPLGTLRNSVALITSSRVPSRWPLVMPSARSNSRHLLASVLRSTHQFISHLLTRGELPRAGADFATQGR